MQCKKGGFPLFSQAFVCVRLDVLSKTHQLYFASWKCADDGHMAAITQKLWRIDSF